MARALRIAVVGSGISGSLCARLLATRHEVTLLEAADRVGGHTQTLEVEAFGEMWPVDTGFMVFNDRTYPQFSRMLELLGIEAQASDMSFSVCCPRTGLEYQGSSLDGLFAQRSNLLSPRFYRMLKDIFCFNRAARRSIDSATADVPLREFLRAESYSQEFIQQYLLPMTAAIWSAPPEAMLEFPASFLFDFLQNHGLLQIFARPQWQTIPGGARGYLWALLHPLGDLVRTSSPVTSIKRLEKGVQVAVAGRESIEFDAVVLATHAPQAMAMLSEPTKTQKEVLGAFRYQPNEAYLHTDLSLLPSRRKAWASWNYRLSEEPDRPASVTYDLSRLQNVSSPQPLLQTLNPTQPIDTTKVLQKLQFEHPLFDKNTRQAQQQRDRLHEDGKIFFCGAYWGYGFHEDGVQSALAVCRHFKVILEDLAQPCIAVSTKAESNM